MGGSVIKYSDEYLGRKGAITWFAPTAVVFLFVKLNQVAVKLTLLKVNTPEFYVFLFLLLLLLWGILISGIWVFQGFSSAQRVVLQGKDIIIYNYFGFKKNYTTGEIKCIKEKSLHPIIRFLRLPLGRKVNYYIIFFQNGKSFSVSGAMPNINKLIAEFGGHGVIAL